MGRRLRRLLIDSLNYIPENDNSDRFLSDYAHYAEPASFDFLLEHKKEQENVSFKHEANSIEFTEAIGDSNSSHCFDQKERDIFLFNHGKKLFKEHPLHKDCKITIKKEIIFTKEEIESLLTPIKCQ